MKNIDMSVFVGQDFDCEFSNVFIDTFGDQVISNLLEAQYLNADRFLCAKNAYTYFLVLSRLILYAACR